MVNRPKRYICSYADCGKAYNRPSLLRQHERTHTNDRPFKCSYKGCDKAFFRQANKAVHELFHKPDSEKPLRCTICGKGANFPHLLRRHELTHTKQFKCTYEGCTEEFYRRGSLNFHVATVHEQVLFCEHCNRRFQSRSQLTDHKLMVHGEGKVFQCEHTGCFTVFKDKRALDKHSKEAHPRIQCPHCASWLIGHDKLNLHLKTHEESASATLWECSSCQESVRFLTKAELIKHYHDIHDGNIPDNILGARDMVELENFLHQASFGPITAANGPKRTYTLADPADIPESQADEEPMVEQAVPDKPIISLVMRNTEKTYVCPRIKCGRKFTRLHAFKKHLTRHEVHLAEIEEFLRRREQEDLLDASGADDSGSEKLQLQDSDHFSDISDSDYYD